MCLMLCTLDTCVDPLVFASPALFSLSLVPFFRVKKQQQGAAAAMYQQYQQHALNGYGDATDADYLMEDDTADLTPRAGGAGGKGSRGGGRSRRAAASRASAATGAAAGGATGNGTGGGYARAGIPGKVCCECGATQTPQWREGPKGECRRWWLWLLWLVAYPEQLWTTFWTSSEAELSRAVQSTNHSSSCWSIGGCAVLCMRAA